jgi:hypothetical protein
MHRYSVALNLVALLAGCGAAETTGIRVDGVLFPSLSDSIVRNWCLRGRLVPDTAVSGGPSSCGVDNFLDGWRVRVPTDREVGITVRSPSTAALALCEMRDINRPPDLADCLLPDEPEMVVTMAAATEYWVFIGLNPVGYTLLLVAPPRGTRTSGWRCLTTRCSCPAAAGLATECPQGYGGAAAAAAAAAGS